MRPNDLSLLKALLRLKTTNAPEDRSEHDRCRELIEREAAARGLRCVKVDSAFPSLLVGTRPEEKSPHVLLTGHLDVVAGAPEQFEARIEDGKLLARGASDMKFAAPLFLRVFEDLPAELRDRVLIAFTFDEETGGIEGTRHLLEQYGLRPRTCFLPDGGDIFQIEAAEKCVFQFRLKTKGKSAHGSRPWLGQNALDVFFDIYRDLRKQFLTVGPEPWGPTVGNCLRRSR